VVSKCSRRRRRRHDRLACPVRQSWRLTGNRWPGSAVMWARRSPRSAPTRAAPSAPVGGAERRIRRVKMRSVYHGVCDIGQVASEAIGWPDGPPPPSPVLLWLPLCSWGYWRKSNGLRLGQRPGGRRYCWPLSWAFRGWGPASGGGSGGTVRNASALPQVRRLALNRSKIVKAFELILLPAPPAGFEPARTAPERVAVQAPDQRKRVPAHHDRGRIGGRRLDRSARPCRPRTPFRT
jgi:hypothetical protein